MEGFLRTDRNVEQHGHMALLNSPLTYTIPGTWDQPTHRDLADPMLPGARYLQMGLLCRRSIRPLIVLAAVSALLVTACTSESRTPSAGGTGTPTAQHDLTRFLLGPDEEPGFAPAEEPRTFSSVGEAFEEGPEGDKERATKDGFQALVLQPLEGAAGAGITNVFQFATEEGAGSWLRYRAGQEFPDTFNRFSVPGVPGAQGFAGTFEGHSVGNVLWTQGRCQLTLGNQANEGGKVSVVALQAAVKAIYQRTAGSCP